MLNSTANQQTFWSGTSRFVIDKPVRLIELFAGIGSQAKALKRLGVDFEHYRVCEWDKYAVCAYNAIHYTDFEPSDITQLTAADLGIVDTDKYCYIMTYSFPCQDLSKAGKGKGMAKGIGTRSGLLWEVERLLNECTELPQMLLMENVPDVVGTKNAAHFYEWLDALEKLGYRNYHQILNATDYGVPQNRERCFMVSLFGDYYYNFPEAVPLVERMKDRLEDNVPEKYYLSDEAAAGLIRAMDKDHTPTLIDDGGGMSDSDRECRQGLPLGHIHSEPRIDVIGTFYPDRENFGHDNDRVFGTDGICCTIKAKGGDYVPKVGIFHE